MKTLDSLTPGVFEERPSSSLVPKMEAERVAANIMKIRRIRGNVWPLTWKEYKQARIEHGVDFSDCEHEWFKRVMPLIGDPLDAALFSPTWAKAAKKALKEAA